MTLPHTQADKLRRSSPSKGVGAIWKLHRAAAAAHRAGFPLSAADLIEVAEAAERAWTSDACRKGGLADVIASLR
jgi:pantoate kinase